MMEQPTDSDMRSQRSLELKNTLNPQQLAACSAIEKAFFDEDEKNRYFFIDDPIGSGKTYLLKTFYKIFTGMGKTIVNTAWTGLAASKLKDGRTVSSLFHLPVPIEEDASSFMKTSDEDEEHLRAAVAIFWDEISICTKYVLEEVDRLLRVITGCDRPFGNKIMVLSGDFRQLLPVARSGGKQGRRDCCVKRSRLWKRFLILPLEQGMCAQHSTGWQQFVLRVGNGAAEKDESYIDLPPRILSAGNLVEEVFGTPVTAEQMGDRAILTLTNETCNEINDHVLGLMPGDAVCYPIKDRTADGPKQDQNTTDPEDYLEDDSTSQMMPPDELKLKVGAPIMLLRNLDINNGLCNGTRLIFEGMKDDALICEIATGSGSGEKAVIHRICLETDKKSSKYWGQWQFPVKLCFAITIDKSQGQTFEWVGLDLRRCVFSHGQLYVALSRARNMDSIKVLLNADYPRQTRNVVCREILK